MKQVQGSFLTGYVTILVKGQMPELFFQKCVKRGILVWNVKKESQTACRGNVKLQDIKLIKEIKRGTDYKLSFVSKKGSPFLLKRFLRKRELVTGLLLSILLIFCLSNIIWDVKITGVPKDIEKKIVKQLDAYGIHPGSWSLTLEPPSVIQQKLVNDIPELLWVGVNKKGTTFFLEGVEKAIVKEKEVKGPRNLIATKKGVIQNMFVSKGLSKVQVNDYVEPGDILVSGKLNFAENENEEDSKKEKAKLVAAEGEVIAKTWYEVKVTVPLKANFEMLTGNKEKKYYLRFGDFKLPIWGFGEPDYKRIQQEENDNAIHFLKWKLPVHFVESILSEKQYEKLERTKEEAIQIGLKQAEKELQLRLGPEAKIISQKVLHETTESGKVKLILYNTVEENIAKAEPINQGD
ncbi:sporulation protein YqfD [Virgibacillus dakarensis]|uniref:sporulation protein YqfD n=1 Tax=Virgibacillus dakarensis TaxID=1917889 RepID=UPI000B446DF2|nr:sporulation protein YqfD [Virgibacillus dakarensis]MBT2214501.1 sporulation protein YqfD [Virgibacillus dakarensis]